MIRAQISSMQEQVLSVSVCGTINNIEFNNTVENIDLLCQIVEIKVLISCKVIVPLICAFVFPYIQKHVFS